MNVFEASQVCCVQSRCSECWQKISGLCQH